MRRTETGFARLRKSAFITNAIVLLCVSLLLLYLLSLVSHDGQVNTFDPYQILNIAQGSTSAEIKKSYRKLSLQYHPDKNPGNKAAEEMFMKIAKAYEALTDETSKENYEKYGNPDGKQSLEVSIGLPRILLDNPKTVLVLYLVAMVIIIPVAVGLWYSNSKKFGEKNIFHDTYSAFFNLVKEEYISELKGKKIEPSYRKFPEILAASAEYRLIMGKSNKLPEKDKLLNQKVLDEVAQKLKDSKEIVAPQFKKDTYPLIFNGNILLHAHLKRLTKDLDASPSLRADLDAMLVKAPELIHGLIMLAFEKKYLETTTQGIKFSQCIIQGLWYKSNPLHQLPHIHENFPLENFPCKTLKEYLKLPSGSRKIKGLSDAEMSDVEIACGILPNVTVTYKLFVEEDEEEEGDASSSSSSSSSNSSSSSSSASSSSSSANSISGTDVYEHDLVTIRVTITRENVTNNKAPSVHAPYFPKKMNESWWFILTDKPAKGKLSHRGISETNIHAFEEVTEQGKQIVHELRFFAPQQVGPCTMVLSVLSNSYMGLDHEGIEINFDVKSAAELPEYVPHPEDVRLDDEPTLFEQVMAGQLDEESSDDDDDDETLNIPAGNSSAGGKASAAATTAKKGGNASDGEDSEED